MVRCYLLNTPVITTDGVYSLKHVPAGTEHTVLRKSLRWESAIGHSGAAEWLTRRLARPVLIARYPVEFRPGDHALVACLPGRILRACELTADDMDRLGCELKHLVRLA